MDECLFLRGFCSYLLVFSSYSGMDTSVRRKARHMNNILCGMMSS